MLQKTQDHWRLPRRDVDNRTRRPSYARRERVRATGCFDRGFFGPAEAQRDAAVARNAARAHRPTCGGPVQARLDPALCAAKTLIACPAGRRCMVLPSHGDHACLHHVSPLPAAHPRCKRCCIGTSRLGARLICAAASDRGVRAAVGPSSHGRVVGDGRCGTLHTSGVREGGFAPASTDLEEERAVDTVLLRAEDGREMFSHRVSLFNASYSAARGRGAPKWCQIQNVYSTWPWWEARRRRARGRGSSLQKTFGMPRSSRR
jgi:hypothetical protein